MTAEDIQRAVEATRVCREFVLAVITGLEEEQSETKEITKQESPGYQYEKNTV